MITLAIDTSTDISVGLAGDAGLLASRRVESTRAHAELLQPSVNAVLAESGVTLPEVDRVAVGLGPGPFTGLRVGIVTARTIAHLGRRPLFGVCSLDVAALQWAQGPHAPGCEFVIAIDARRRELYWARYDAGGRRLDEPQVNAPADLPDLPTAGPGAALYAEVLGERVSLGGPHRVDAAFLATHVDQLPDAGVEPLYLRQPDAVVPTTRKSTLLQPRLSLRSRGVAHR